MIISMEVVALEYEGSGGFALESEPLRRRGLELRTVPYGLLQERSLRADVVINAGDYPLPAPLLDRLDGCRAIVSYGVGVDWVDLDEASARGIVIANTPHANVLDVAEHSLALLLACARRLLEYDRGIRAGDFRPSPPLEHHRLAGRTLGLLAFGNIARSLARLAAPLGLEIIAHDPYADAELFAAEGVEPVGLDDLLRRSHLLSVHLPATASSRGLLDAQRLAQLPHGAILVITSRGAVYDADAVADALASGRLSSAGLDVFPTEPLPAGHRLTACPTAILTPHMAGASEEAERDAHASVAACVEAMLSGQTPVTALNADRL
jgi:D-3-phosphoglycerate dehydrogenase